MKKRFVSVFCALMLGALSAFPAAADVIIEPDDSFYTSHWEECDYLGNQYYANGQTGTLTGYRSPESKQEKKTFQNGELLYISFTYTDETGTDWGVVEQNDGTCWVRLDEIVRKYDSELFREEHADALAPFDDQAGDYERLRDLDGEIVVWTYPGSGESSGTITEFEGGPDCWICLDDPTNAALPVNETLTAMPVLHQAQPDAPESEHKPERSTELLLAGGLVVAVVGMTAVLLVVFYRRKNSEDLH